MIDLLLDLDIGADEQTLFLLFQILIIPHYVLNESIILIRPREE